MTTDRQHLNGPAQGATDDARLLADWREAVTKEIAALGAANAAPSDPDINRDYDAATERVRALAREAWARPVSGPTALRLRAAIAQHCLWGNYSNSEGAPRFEAVLSGENAEKYLQLDAFDERAVAELVKAVLWTAQATPARSEPAARDWLAMLRDAGPNGAAPDPRHAAIWGAILDLRGCRDAIENTVEQMTQRLDWLADETTLTHAIVAGWEPEEDATAEPEPARAAPGNSEGIVYELPGDLEDLVGRARDGVTALWTLWGSHCISPEEFPDQKFAASLKFCIDGIDALLEKADQQIESAIEARRPPG